MYYKYVRMDVYVCMSTRMHALLGGHVTCLPWAAATELLQLLICRSTIHAEPDLSIDKSIDSQPNMTAVVL